MLVFVSSHTSLKRAQCGHFAKAAMSKPALYTTTIVGTTISRPQFSGGNWPFVELPANPTFCGLGGIFGRKQHNFVAV